MSGILDSPDVLVALRQRKRVIKRRLDASRLQMTERASFLTGGSVQKKADRLHGIGRIVVNAFAVYRGIRLCTDIISGIRSVFTPRKRRR